MGGVGSLRASQVIQFNQLIDLNEIAATGIDTSFIINSLVPVMVAQLQSHGVACGMQSDSEENSQSASIMMPNVFLFAYKDKA